MHDKIKEYLDTVEAQIRWKKAKPIIRKDLENHIYDQQEAYIKDGYDKEKATQKAIEQMGEAVFIGNELDKAYKPKPQPAIFIIVAALIAFGAMFNLALQSSGMSIRTVSIFPYIVSFLIFTACYYADFTLLGKYAFKIYLVVLCLALWTFLRVFIMGNYTFNMLFLGIAVNVKYFWILFSVAFMLLLYDLKNKGIKGILFAFGAFMFFGYVLLIIPTFTGFISYVVVSIVSLCVLINKGYFFANKKQGMLCVLAPSFLVSVFGFFIILNTVRFKVFLNPEPYKADKGYQYYITRDIIKNSSFIGHAEYALEGICHRDYELTYMIGKFGLFVFVILSLLFALLFYFALKKASKEKSVLGLLISISVITIIMLQVFLYMTENLGYGLFSSLSLPFVTYSKTSLFINSAIIGFMLSVFRTGDIFDDKYSSNAQKPIFEYKDGSIIINIK